MFNTKSNIVYLEKLSIPYVCIVCANHHDTAMTPKTAKTGVDRRQETD